ncbi:Uncharacterized protein Rs2_38167 [Raphanus sativus]|nr:Uncharacterized protein Rs2_38167 [Raphanus sativus]
MNGNGVCSAALFLICLFISIGMINARSTGSPYCRKLPAAYAAADVCTKPNFDAVCLSACKKEHLPRGKSRLYLTGPFGFDDGASLNDAMQDSFRRPLLQEFIQKAW